jgi:hypothetical protein
MADDDDPDEDLEVLTDGGVEVEAVDEVDAETEESENVDEEFIDDVLEAVRQAKRRGISDAAIAGSVDAVGEDLCDALEIPESLIVEQRFGVQLSQYDADSVEELAERLEDAEQEAAIQRGRAKEFRRLLDEFVDQASDEPSRRWFDPRGWF